MKNPEFNNNNSYWVILKIYHLPPGNKYCVIYSNKMHFMLICTDLLRNDCTIFFQWILGIEIIHSPTTMSISTIVESRNRCQWVSLVVFIAITVLCWFSSRKLPRPCDKVENVIFLMEFCFRNFHLQHMIGR